MGRIDEGTQWQTLRMLSFFKLSTQTKLDFACVHVCASLISWSYRRITPSPPICTQSSFIPLQLKYKKDLDKMKGTSHFHSLTSEDNVALMNARKINKFVSEVSDCQALKANSRPSFITSAIYPFPSVLTKPFNVAAQCVCVRLRARNMGYTVSVSEQIWCPATCIFGISNMPLQCGYSLLPRPQDIPSYTNVVSHRNTVLHSWATMQSLENMTITEITLYLSVNNVCIRARILIGDKILPVFILVVKLTC